MLRRRPVEGGPTEAEEPKNQSPRGKSKSSRKEQSHHRPLWQTAFIYSCFIVITLIYGKIVASTIYELPQTDVGLPLKPLSNQEFSETRAHAHLVHLAETIGRRLTSTKALEIDAVNYITSQLQDFKDHACPNDDKTTCSDIEVDIQKATGSFSLFFVMKLIHNSYANITNIVVRVSDGTEEGKNREALLVNAHFDSALDVPGAGDDAVAVSALLDCVRVWAASAPPYYPIIFLFNGAEEPILDGADGFIKTHPWAQNVKAVLNFDAAGTYGHTLLFQSGRADLVRAYARHVKMPQGGVLVQDVFASGIIPSDTDYRIFRDSGVKGLDMALHINGYFYHTELDTPKAVTQGTLQHMGDIALTMTRAIAAQDADILNNPDPTEEPCPIYFDVYGQVMVVYSFMLSNLLNASGCILAVVLFFLTAPASSPSKNRKSPLWQRFAHLLVEILKCSGPVFCSFFFGLLLAVLTAAIMSFISPLSYYAHPMYALLLYGTPTWLGAMIVQGIIWLRASDEKVELETYRGIMSFNTVLLALMTLAGIRSAFFFFIWNLAAAAALAIFYWGIYRHSPNYKEHHQQLARSDGREDVRGRYKISERSFLKEFLLRGVIVAAISFPYSLSFRLVFTALDLLVPILGRAGAEIPVDLGLAVIVSLLLILISLIFLPFFHWAKNRKQVIAALSVIYLLVVLYTIFLSFPYDESHPKRVFLQHALAYDPPLFVSEDYKAEFISKGGVKRATAGVTNSLVHFDWKETGGGAGGKWKNSMGKTVATRMISGRSIKNYVGVDLPIEDIAFISMVDPYPVSSLAKAMSAKGPLKSGRDLSGYNEHVTHFKDHPYWQTGYPFKEFLSGLQVDLPIAHNDPVYRASVAPYMVLLKDEVDEDKDTVTKHFLVKYTGNEYATMMIEGDALVGWSLNEFPENKTEKVYFIRHIAGRGFEGDKDWRFSLTFKRSHRKPDSKWPRKAGGSDVVKVSVTGTHTIYTPIINEIKERMPSWATPIAFLTSYVEYYIAV